LNKRPRKILGYQTPRVVFSQELAQAQASSCKTLFVALQT
jgi:hypothetical protein